MTTDNAAEIGSPSYFVRQMQIANAPPQVIAEYQAKHGLTSAPAGTTTPAPTPPTEPVHSASPAPAAPGRIGGPGSDPAHWLDQMKAAGAGEAQIAQAARELGLSDEQYAAMKAGADGAEAHLTALGFPPASSPQDFSLPPLTVEGGDAELIAATKEVQGWLHSAKLTPEIGNAIAKEAAAYQQRWDKMSDAERTLDVRNTQAMLQRMWGAQYAETLEATQALVRELDTKAGGRLVEWLEVSGAGNSLQVAAQLGLHAMRLKARQPEATK